jgi:small subunit ribosomal protein S5
MAELQESREELAELDLEDRVIRVDRVRKTVKGGRIPSSRVVVAVGDGRGRVGLALGKARQAPDAIRKAIDKARKNLITVPLDGYTIPHEVQATVGGAKILLRPASRGTGIIAGGAVRHIVELSGIRDILTKSLGSQNVMNRAKACFKALSLLMDPDGTAKARGKSVHEMCGREVVSAYDATQAARSDGMDEAAQVAMEEAGGR